MQDGLITEVLIENEWVDIRKITNAAGSTNVNTVRRIVRYLGHQTRDRYSGSDRRRQKDIALSQEVDSMIKQLCSK